MPITLYSPEKGLLLLCSVARWCCSLGRVAIRRSQATSIFNVIILNGLRILRRGRPRTPMLCGWATAQTVDSVIVRCTTTGSVAVFLVRRSGLCPKPVVNIVVVHLKVLFPLLICSAWTGNKSVEVYTTMLNFAYPACPSRVSRAVSAGLVVAVTTFLLTC